ncbi:MGH1-like glycoside hydrolase domain-containing protein [Pacificoceanicola onchidii]|uniref:MGH1-like glycoside hydrolase domain-containing protein n=1 Tax=Pacificoceanicola onchidii TaxID=2562685 RepID=UPI0010A2FD4B
MSKDTISMDEQARAILRGNDRGGYTVPTAGLYPYQWNWDSAFAAWGFAQFDLERAWDELTTLFDGQWPSGMVPHIQFHQPDPGYFPGADVWGAETKGPVPSSGVSQPPVAATFALAVYRKNPDQGQAALKALFPKMVKWHRWFMDWRNDNGAIFITHPWEAGRDNAPDWDEAMAAIDPVGVGEYTRRDTSHVDPAMRPTKADYDRYIWLVQRGSRLDWDEAAMAQDMPFKVADPTMTFILLRANRDLATIADALGEDRTEIDGWTKVLEAGTARLRNPETGSYNAVNLITGNHTGNVSNASFLCWYAGIESADMMRELHEAFETCSYPVASHKPGDETFDAKRYWRGPTWAIVNALIGYGLAGMGHHAEAQKLRALTAGLIAKYGFAEYFDPTSGDPAGGGTFTWTAAVWLAWASPNVEGA